MDFFSKWLTDAYNHWDELRKSSDAGKIGVTQLSGYIFSEHSKNVVRNHYMEKLCPIYRAATDDEFQLCKGNWKYGSYFTTILTDCTMYLPWALQKFKRQGGQLIQKKLKNLNELPKHDIVINCTGLGAQELCDDYKLVPIRGQVFKVKANWIKMAFYGDYDTYIIPGFNAVTLGGCRNYDSYDVSWSKHDASGIWERCEKMLPNLKRAEIVSKKVGLRPHRDPVRVEIELKHNQDGDIQQIVHNYGHGGYGVLSAPGTCKYAMGLVRDLLRSNSKL